MMASTKPLFISEEEVRNIMTWDAIVDATEQAIIAVSCKDGESPSAMQPARSMTKIADVNGILFAMPGYLQGVTLNNNKVNALGCKLVTSFTNNMSLEPPLPNILATILLFDDATGRLKCVMEATEITAWRTAAASVVATKHLRSKNSKNKILSIFGSGTQARSHALGFQHCFGFEQVRIWNYNIKTAKKLANELQETLGGCVRAFESGEECARDADVVVTATYSATPVLKLDWLKSNVHINAVGAGANHHSELDIPLYQASTIFVDSWVGANSELGGLKDLGASIAGEVGQVIRKKLAVPDGSITVFHSMGMAVEDTAAAKLIYDLYLQKQK